VIREAEMFHSRSPSPAQPTFCNPVQAQNSSAPPDRKNKGRTAAWVQAISLVRLPSIRSFTLHSRIAWVTIPN
jgi:hypothetical protein